MFIISVIVKSSCRILHFLHQMFNVSVLLLDDALLQNSSCFNCCF